MSRFINPRPQFFDSSGNIVSSGKLYFFESDGTTEKDTFNEVNQSVNSKNTNPVILSADGRAPNIFYSGTARVKLTDSDDVQIWDISDVGSFADGGAFAIWNSSTEYAAGAIVEGSNGAYYRSIQNSNTGNDPTSSPTQWEEVEFVRTWNTNVTYSMDDFVKASDGLLYRSLINNNTGNDPTSSPTQWGSAIALAAQAQFEQPVNDLGNVSSSTNIDYSTSQVHKCTMTASAAFTFTNSPDADFLGYIWIQIIDGDTFAPDFTSNNTIEWAGGVTPVPTAKDVWLFETIDGGSSWYGSARGFS